MCGTEALLLEETVPWPLSKFETLAKLHSRVREMRYKKQASFEKLEEAHTLNVTCFNYTPCL